MINFKAIVFCFMVFLLFGPLQVRAQNVMVRQQATMRDSATATGTILDVLAPGMNVELVKIQGDWARVRLPLNLEMGWVEKNCLDITGAEARKVSPLPSSGIGASDIRGLENRVAGMNQSLVGLEDRVDNLIGRMEEKGYVPARTKAGQGSATPSAQTPGTGLESEPGGFYAWRNRFYMGKYFKGAQDFYGLSLSRLLDRGGYNVVDAEGGYALGEARGKKDDFIEWSLGLSFNLKPRDYWIYPVIGAHFGMRHLLDPAAAPKRFFLAAPGVGLNAELGRFFLLSVETRGVFLFRSGERSDEGRISFSCGYSY